MPTPHQVRSVARNIEMLVEELPIALLRLDEIKAGIEERLDWREFNFWFKVATAKVVRILFKKFCPFFNLGTVAEIINFLPLMMFFPMDK